MADDGSVRATPDPRAVDSVMRAIDFVEASLGRCIGLAEMAEAACYSAFYFSRLFSQATGHAPYDYLMRRRVAVAAEDVVGGKAGLIDIALERGFGSPDAFARAFRRCFGMAPSEARRAGAYPAAIARARIASPAVEEFLLRPFPPPEPLEAGSALVDSSGSAETGNGVRVEISRRDAALSPLEPFSGALRSSGSTLPLDYPGRSILLPAGRLARFGIEPSAGRLGFVLERAYRSWLPLSGMRAAPEFDIVEFGSGGKPAFLSIFLVRIESSPPGRSAKGIETRQR